VMFDYEIWSVVSTALTALRLQYLSINQA